MVKQIIFFKREFKEFKLTPTSIDNYIKQKNGDYKGVPLLTTNGIKIWLEHFSLKNPTDFNIKNAFQADIVISCYPFYNSKLNKLNNVLFKNHRLRCTTALINGDTLLVETQGKGDYEDFFELCPLEKNDFILWANDIKNSFSEKERENIVKMKC